jgi:hypothetical protein
VKISRHARNEMRLYGITESNISTVLAAPDGTAPSVHGRTNAWKLMGGRTIQVTFIVERGETVVVTTFPKR